MAIREAAVCRLTVSYSIALSHDRVSQAYKDM